MSFLCDFCSRSVGSRCNRVLDGFAPPLVQNVIPLVLEGSIRRFRASAPEED